MPVLVPFQAIIHRTKPKEDPRAMAESSDFLGFVKRHFEDVKEHWKSNFAFLDYYKKTLGRKEPLPKWTDADVEEFIASDPIYGPQVLLSSNIWSRPSSLIRFGIG